MADGAVAAGGAGVGGALVAGGAGAGAPLDFAGAAPWAKELALHSVTASATPRDEKGENLTADRSRRGR